MTNREICLKAAARLREVGWQQGGFGDKGGPHCMIGACRWAVEWYTSTAVHLLDRTATEVELAVDAVGARTAALSAAHNAALAAVNNTALSAVRNAVLSVRDLAGRVRAADWNDAPGRTAEEVIAALEACP